MSADYPVDYFDQRFRVPGPKNWMNLSDSLLRRRFGDSQRRVLGAFGLTEPLKVEDLDAFLEHYRDSSCEEDGTRNPGIYAEYVGSEDDWYPWPFSAVFYRPDAGPIALLAAESERIAAHTSMEQWQGVTYLLCNTTVFGLPWIEIKADMPNGPMGASYSIIVGSEYVTAEALREAWVEFGRARFGQENAPSLVDDAIYWHEIESRHAFRTWEQSWTAWWPKADAIGANRYDETTAYRNKVESLRRRFPWMKETFDVAGQRNDPEYLRQMQQSSLSQGDPSEGR